METKQNSVTVTLTYGALTSAAEVLATLLASAVVKATLLAPDLYRILLINTPITNGDNTTQSQDKQRDAEGEDGNDDEGDEDDEEMVDLGRVKRSCRLKMEVDMATIPTTRATQRRHPKVAQVGWRRTEKRKKMKRVMIKRMTMRMTTRMRMMKTREGKKRRMRVVRMMKMKRKRKMKTKKHCSPQRKERSEFSLVKPPVLYCCVRIWLLTSMFLLFWVLNFHVFI
uniref:Uncharacterized protein n=1 Tax=Phaseolus vulgaris TaxID=3885 RepID=T2DMD0_PHAVU|nr:hypothetical protein [Phaseolus vulgaris]